MITAYRGILSQLIFLLGASLAGCAHNPVQTGEVTDEEVELAIQRSAITTEELSAHSMQVLRILALDDLWKRDRTAVAAVLEKPDAGMEDWLRLMTRAEICYLIGKQSSDHPQRSRPWFLDAILTAFESVSGFTGELSVLDPRHRLLVDLYNRGLARLLGATLATQGQPKSWKQLEGRGVRYPLQVIRGEGLWEVDYFDAYVVADQVSFTGFTSHFREYGLGVPLIGVRDNLDKASPSGRKQAEYPPMITRPVTALLRLREGGILELLLVNPREMDSYPSSRGGKIPLAADFTAALGYLIANSRLHVMENRGFFRPEETLPLTGLYFSEPYDPDKIPLVLVHGLWSSPLTWINLVNEIRGDPLLGKRYQVWTFAYPSGLPILLSAAGFRRALTGTRERLDPEGDDPAMSGMVLVGHSMGGLLSKIMVEDSGTRLWDEVFTGPAEEMDLTEEERDTLRELLIFEHLPFIHRVVFMACPHRGSSLAEGLVGGVGSALISLPAKFVGFVSRITQRNRDKLHLDEGETPRVSNAIDNLETDSTLLEILNEIPFRAGLPYHSIIGNEEGPVADPESTDGVVPYSSSHLEGAQSELVIESDHSLTGKPRAILEVRRILRLHLGIE